MSRRKKIVAALLATTVIGIAAVGCGGEQPAKVSDEGTSNVVKEQADDVVVEEAESTDDLVVEEAESTDTTASLGDTVEVGDWSVTVTEVALNADAAIRKANMFNEKPRGQYVLVSYDATYNGAERTADAWMDLTWTLTGNDGKVLDESSQVTPAEDKSAPTEARRDGTVSIQAVFDVKPRVLRDSILSVEGYDADFNTVYADFAIKS